VKTAILLIAHGSREPEANADLEHVAAEMRKRARCKIAVASYLEIAEPGIVEGGRRCVEAGARCIVMLPYFLSAGTHVRRDLAAAQTKLAKMFPNVEFLLAEPLGPHPLMIQVVMDRFREVLLRQLENDHVDS
jgi:sirohydrochlorin ferrochelatase